MNITLAILATAAGFVCAWTIARALNELLDALSKRHCRRKAQEARTMGREDLARAWDTVAKMPRIQKETP